MNYLAIDTSRSSLTVAVGGKNKAVKFLPDCALTHSVVLMGEIENALAAAKIDKKDIDVFACAVGPGSFTGIRIGIATVKALAYALGKKVLGVTSFDSLAYNVSDGRKKLAVIDARHGNFYACGYAADDIDGADGRIDLSPRFIDTAALGGLAREHETISAQKIGNPNGFPKRLADVEDGFIKAVEANLGKASENVETLVPLYVKKGQAEEEE